MTEEKNNEEKKEYKTITIRGIDEKLYKKIVSLSKETGETVGELVNRGLKMVIDAMSTGSSFIRKAVVPGKAFMEGLSQAWEKKGEVQEAMIISDIGELELSKEDLEVTEKRIVFKKIGKLTIKPDVNFDLFKEKVESIILVDELYIPNTFPKLEIASMSRMVKKISSYESKK